jgi:UDPglucose--hexose-1-phosphate uridylyltransferase
MSDPQLHPDTPHRRFNQLTGEWVLVSPQRMLRPWEGQIERVPLVARPEYDPKCYLCPGNERAEGQRNPSYDTTFAFTNDFPSLLPDSTASVPSSSELLRTQPVRGTSRVLCFSPRHDLTLAEMTAAQIEMVIDLWSKETAELGKRYRWVQVFENKGEVMGCSNPHPHGQVWALDALPSEPAREDQQQRAYFEKRARPLLLDYIDAELEDGARVVGENRHWLAVVPFWATWPFELLLLPRHVVTRIPDLTGAQRTGLADILRQMLVRYDNLFETSFPYSMGWHGAPYDDGDQSHWQLHAHFYPPLLRSATVKKFMVGFEMLGEAQRDLTPEAAADKLRSQSDTHFRRNSK